MLHSHYHHHLLLLTQHHYSPLSHSSSPYLLHFLHKPIRTIHTVAAIPPASLPWLTHLAQLNSTTVTEEDLNSVFVPINNDPFILVVSSAVILTTIITAVFRSNRRRAKRAQELKLRYSEVKKSMDSLKVMGSSPIKVKSKRRKHRPDEALLGAAISAGVAYCLIKFTISIDADFSRQALSHNFSVRQFTITLRTIIIDLCYLAIFIYGFSSIGLLLYSGELAFDMSTGRPSGKGTRSKITEESDLSDVESLTCNNEMASTKEDQSSKNSQ